MTDKKKDIIAIQQRYLKYGDTILLHLDGKTGYVSGSDILTPQLRVEDMADGGDTPPDIRMCLFVVMQKHQYTQKMAFQRQLSDAGYQEDILNVWNAQGNNDAHTFSEVKDKSMRLRLQMMDNGYGREQAVNAEEFLQSIGENVLYGQAVQLKHVVSGKMVTIKRTAADVERGALKVILDDIGSPGSWFNVYSGYRTKPEGSKVMMNEIISLKSAGFNGMALHLSSNPIKDRTMLPVDLHQLVELSWEISASPDPATFKIIPHTIHERLMPTRSAQICGLSCVSIQDLVANTAYANVLCCEESRLFFESPLARPNVTYVNGCDVFRLEPESLQFSGHPLTNGMKVRIRHLVTGQYLDANSEKAKEAIEKLKKAPGGLANLDTVDSPDMHVGLTHNFREKSTVWELVLFSKEDNAMQLKSYVFFKHVDTGLWLSGAGTMLKLENGEEAMEGAERVYPVVHPIKLERNVMVVFEVDKAFVEKVHSVTHCISVLKFFKDELGKVQLEPEAELVQMNVETMTQKLRQSKLKEAYSSVWNVLKGTLNNMERMFDFEKWQDTEDADAPKVFQTLARETRLLDYMVDCLVGARVAAVDACPEIKASSLGRWSNRLGLQLHRCLQLCCVKNEANQAYVSRWSDVVMRHLSTPLKAADTLAALYQDNMTQMQSITQDIITESVNLIRKYGHNSRFINFLIQICGPKESPIPINQNWLVQEILQGEKPTFIFFKGGLGKVPDVNGKSYISWVCHVTTAAGQVLKIDCAEFYRCTEDVSTKSIWEWDANTDQSELTDEAAAAAVGTPEDIQRQERRGLFVYYVASLSLMVSLCNGRNGLARNTLLEASKTHGLGLDYKSLHDAMCSRTLPYVLRSIFAQLMLVLYVDVDPYQAVKVPKLVRMLLPPNSAMKEEVALHAPPSDSLKELVQTVRMLVDHVLVVEKKEQVEQVEAANNTEEKKEEKKEKDEEPEEQANNDDKNLPKGYQTVGRNTWVCMLLRIAREFFRLGLLPSAEQEAEDVLVLLLKLLHELDCLPEDSKDRFRVNNITGMVMEAKRITLQTVEMAMDQQTDDQCFKVFTIFSEWQRQSGSMANFKTMQPNTSDNSTAAKGRLGSQTSNKVVPETIAEGWVNDAPRNESLEKAILKGVEALRSMDEHEVGLFRFNPAGRELDIPDRDTSSLSQLLELVRYREPTLAAKVYQLMERAVSKRSAVISSLMRTFLVTDPALILISRRIHELMLDASHAYSYMGSLKQEERDKACEDAVASISSLTELLKPMETLKFSHKGESHVHTVFISKAMASNVQFLMNDMGVHEVAIKFLRLPLRRKPQVDRRTMVEPDDEKRQDVFAECLNLISEFMVIGNDKTDICIPNAMNQATVLPHLDLLTSFLNVKNLPVADSVGSLFERNVDIATKQGPAILNRFVKLLVQYGHKQQSRWLDLLRRLLIVDGQPIKANQSNVLKLASQYESEFLLLFNEEGALSHLLEFMVGASMKLKVKKKKKASEVTASELSYHTSCVKLLAECCDGKEPELIVKASGYLSLQQLIEALLLCHGSESKGVVSKISREVASAYWKFIRLVYFSTDTENTRMQVRAPGNRIWPAKEAIAGITANSSQVTMPGLASFLGMAEKANEAEQTGPSPPTPLVAPPSPTSPDQGNLRDPAALLQSPSTSPPASKAPEDGVQPVAADLLRPESRNLSNIFSDEPLLHGPGSGKLPDGISGPKSSTDLPSPMVPNLVSSGGSIREPPWGNREGSVSRPMSAIRLPKMPDPPRPPTPPPAMTPPPASPAPEAPSPEAASLMEIVLISLDRAISEARDALTSNESASFFMAYAVLPALVEYFETHYGSHVSKLPDAHTAVLKVLQEKVAGYLQAVKAVEKTEFAQATKDQRRQAMTTGRKLLRLLHTYVPLEGKVANMVLGKSTKYASSNATSKEAMMLQKMVHSDWEKFYKGIASRLAVVIDTTTYEVVELRAGGDGTLVKYCNIFMLSRFFTPKNMTAVAIANPTMYYEEGVKRLCDLLASFAPAIMDWPLELTVGMLRVLQGVLAIDDGHASTSAWQSGWKGLGFLLDSATGFPVEVEELSEDDEAYEQNVERWRQNKYHVLRMTLAALKLLAHPRFEVQFEALQLLSALLNDGNKLVQDAVCQELSGRAEWVITVFQNLHASFERCAKYLRKGKRDKSSKERQKVRAALYSSTEASEGIIDRVRDEIQEKLGVEGVAKLAGKKEKRKEGKGEAPKEAQPMPPIKEEGGEAEDVLPDEPEETTADEEEEQVWALKVAKVNEADNPLLFCKTVLGCLTQMCEGHHSEMQSLLQMQPNSASSVDLLTDSVELMMVLQDNLQVALVKHDEDVQQLMKSVFFCLMEMIQGPASQNQATLAATNFLVTCNRIFGYVEYNKKASLELPHLAKAKCEIKTRLMNLLLSLLEGMQDEDIPIRCKEIIDWAAVDRQVESLWSMVSSNFFAELEDADEEEVKEVNEMLVRELLYLCCFVMKVNASSPSRAPVLPYIQVLYKAPLNPEMWQDDVPNDKRAMAVEFQPFLQSHIGYVEINWKGRLEPEFFLIPEECWKMKGGSTWCKRNVDRLQSNVSPESRQFPPVKAAEFVDAMTDVCEEIELEEMLSNDEWTRWVRYLLTLRVFLLEVTFYLALICLAIMTLTNDTYTNDAPFTERFEIDSGDDWKPRLLIFFNVIQICSTVLLTVLFCLYDATKYIRAKKRKWAEAEEKEQMDKEESTKGALGFPKAPKKRAVSRQKTIRTAFKIIFELLFFWKFWYILKLLASSILSLLISPFFMVLQFSIYFLEFETGRSLVEAMARSGLNIINTMVLGVLLIFTCAVITYNAFPSALQNDGGVDPPCATFYQCMGTHMLAGIYGDIEPLFGSANVDNVPQNVDEEMEEQARSLYILIFFMLWNFVVSNIFIGLIASAFEEIREDQNTIKTDSQSKCLVCSLDMYTLDDKTKGGFDEHLRGDHNANNYVFFLYQMWKKDPATYSGVETAVNNTINNAMTTTEQGGWLPISRCLALSGSTTA